MIDLEFNRGFDDGGYVEKLLLGNKVSFATAFHVNSSDFDTWYGSESVCNKMKDFVMAAGGISDYVVSVYAMGKKRVWISDTLFYSV